MNNSKIKLLLYFIIGALSAFLVMYLVNNYKIEKKNQDSSATEVSRTSDKSNNEYDRGSNKSENTTSSEDISELTRDDVVIDYVKEHRELPEYYVTKSEARSQGWNPGQSLCDAVPGKAIGGDHFSNREHNLPDGNQYFEADVNYKCGHRQAERIIFTKNGDVWLTRDHYKTFEKQ